MVMPKAQIKGSLSVNLRDMYNGRLSIHVNIQHRMQNNAT